MFACLQRQCTLSSPSLQNIVEWWWYHGYIFCLWNFTSVDVILYGSRHLCANNGPNLIRSNIISLHGPNFGSFVFHTRCKISSEKSNVNRFHSESLLRVYLLFHREYFPQDITAGMVLKKLYYFMRTFLWDSGYHSLRRMFLQDNHQVENLSVAFTYIRHSWTYFCLVH